MRVEGRTRARTTDHRRGIVWSSPRRLVQVVRLLAESHETVQRRRKRREPSETKENETEVGDASW